MKRHATEMNKFSMTTIYFILLIIINKLLFIKFTLPVDDMSESYFHLVHGKVLTNAIPVNTCKRHCTP